MASLRPIRIDKCPRCGTTLRERSLEKNGRLHSALTAVSKQKQWFGKWLTVVAWKRLFVAAYERSKGRPAELYPAIDGEGMDVVYTRTSRMSEEEIRELIHFVEAQALEWGVELGEVA